MLSKALSRLSLKSKVPSGIKELSDRMPQGLKSLSKKALIQSFKVTKLHQVSHYAQIALFSPFIRVINCHDVPAHSAKNFEEQLKYYKKHFVPVGYHDLLDLVHGKWEHRKPGLMITFDDGLETHLSVARPLLEKYGFTGFFFISPGFVDIPVEKQAQYGRDHRINWHRRDEGKRGSLTWDEIRELDKNHVIGSHTYTHVRLSDELSPAQLRYEIIESKNRLVQELQRDVDVFCWVGGEKWSYTKEAAQVIKDAGYKISFMNQKFIVQPQTDLLQLHRTCIEAWEDMDTAKFLLSGFMDVLFAQERKNVDRLTKVY